MRAHLVILALAALLPVLALGGGAAWEAVQAYRGAFEARLLDRARGLAGILVSEIETVEAALRVLAASSGLDPASDVSEFESRARGAAAALGTWIVLADHEGHQRINTHLPPGTPLGPTRNPGFYRQAIETGRTVVTDLVISTTTREPLVAIIVPVPGPAGRPVGVLGAPLDLERLSRLLAAQGLGEGAFATLADSHMRVVARSADHQRLIGTPAPSWMVEAMAGRQSGLVRGPNAGGVDVLLAFERLRGQPGWLLAVGERWDDYRASWLSPLLTLLLGGFLALLTALLTVRWVARRVLRPVTALAERAGEATQHPNVAGAIAAAIPPAAVSEFESMRVGLVEAEAALRRDAARQALLLGLSRAMLEGEATEAVLAEAAFDWLCPALDADIGLSHAVDEAGGLLRLIAVRGLSADRTDLTRLVALDTGFAGLADATGAGVAADAVRVAVDRAGNIARRLGARAVASQPLLDRTGCALGTLTLASTRRECFEPVELGLLEAASHMLALAWRRSRAEADLRGGEAALRRAAESARFATFDIHSAAGRFVVSDLFREMWGLEPDMPISFPTLLHRVHPADRPAVERHRARTAKEGGSFEIEFRVLRPDGSVRWLLSRGEAVSNPSGDLPARISGVNVDVTERKAAEERQALLTREVDHRAKNALAVVQAAMRLTPKTDAAAYATAVEGRVDALARAHSLLAGHKWAGADLRALLAAELAPFLASASGTERRRAELDGPEVMLPPQATQPLAMAVHELATNAVKHGALSAAEGRVLVSWRFAGAKAAPRLSLRWTELGGPAVAGPPLRRGFGTRVLDATLRRQLGGEVSLTWKQTGLVCDLQVSLTYSSDMSGLSGSAGVVVD
ncbi:HWE histidine kinase domain-containing protein [Falsiroseomonas sp. HW251]|uniref:HWE histidine kinase domain-containing protein n=1 Tax=Falsiroseomonas sp. HW251 TaxID=3390998 RepID=UPI003D3206CF